MIFIKIQAQAQVEGGQVKTFDLRVNPESIVALIKQPLEPMMVCMLGSSPVITLTQMPPAVTGLVRLETWENGSALINPKFVQFYHSPDIGKYTLVCAGGLQIAARSTGEQLKQLIEVDANSIRIA